MKIHAIIQAMVLRMKRLSGLILIVLAAIQLAACDQPQRYVFQGATMGTTFSVKVVALSLSSEEVEALQTDLESELLRVNGLMSTYQEDSELSLFNRVDIMQWMEMSDDTLKVLQAGQWLSQVSNGAFDVTVGPLVNLWGFGPTPSAEEIPTEKAILEAKNKVGFQYLQIESGRVRKVRDIYVDLSAIAKGFGVDQLASLLESKGFEHYLVEIGGELRGKGQNEHGKSWAVGIEKPDTLPGSLYRVLEIENQSVATSGDYRNFFEIEDRVYSHTINPTTGRPVTHHLASVTVISSTALMADGWATTLNVLGEEDGLKLADKHEVAALFLIREDEVFRERVTPAFERLMNFRGHAGDD